MIEIQNISFYIIKNNCLKYDASYWAYYKLNKPIKVPKLISEDLKNLSSFLLGWCYCFVNKDEFLQEECKDCSIILKHWEYSSIN